MNGVKLWIHRITESQNGRGWQGPLWVTQPNPRPKQGHSQQAAQDRGPEKETPQPLWAACSRAPSPSKWRSSSSCSDRKILSYKIGLDINLLINPGKKKRLKRDEASSCEGRLFIRTAVLSRSGLASPVFVALWGATSAFAIPTFTVSVLLFQGQSVVFCVRSSKPAAASGSKKRTCCLGSFLCSEPIFRYRKIRGVYLGVTFWGSHISFSIINEEVFHFTETSSSQRTFLVENRQPSIYERFLRFHWPFGFFWAFSSLPLQGLRFLAQLSLLSLPDESLVFFLLEAVTEGVIQPTHMWSTKPLLKWNWK